MNLWIAIGVLILLALACVLLPLLRKRKALGETTAATRWSAAGVLGMLPAVTIGLYMYLGAPGILTEQALTQAQTSYDVDGMVKALEGKLKANPNDPEGWYALGRAYIAYQRYDDAEEALRKATIQAPKDARIIAQYAEAIALKQGNLSGRPMELIQTALDISYEETKALELAGLDAFQREKWAEALHYWRRLVKLLPKDTDHHDAIAQAVATAERKLDLSLGGSGMPAPPPPPQKPKLAPH